MEGPSISMVHAKIPKQKNKQSYVNLKNNHHLKSKKNITKNNNHNFSGEKKRDHHNFHRNLAVKSSKNNQNHRSNFYKHGRYNVNRSAANSYVNGNDNDVNVNLESVKTYSDNVSVDNKGVGTGLYNDCVTKINSGDEEEEAKEKGGLMLGKHEELIIGKFTREVYNAICLRLGDTLHIPEASVKELFNDMHLFPSDTQVTKMLQCARQYSRRNGTNHNYLTFGEFCVFVREMQNHQSPKAHRKPSQQKVNHNKCPNNKCEVFLGGSCNPTTWRADTAIPQLQKYGISFYNPQVSIWAPELLAQEHDAKQSASVLLFVIDSQTRSTVGMLEVAYLVASGRCVIVVAQPYRIGQSIMGETITDREYYDLVQGQKSLLDLIKSRGVQIHSNLPTALQCTADILRNVSMNGTTPEEQITHKLRRLREVYDSYNGQMKIFDVIEAYQRLTNRSLEISKLYNYLNLQNGNVANYNAGNCGNNGISCANGTVLSFEKFCAVMAELSTDGCGMCNIEGRDYIRPLYWSCALLKTRYVVRNMVLQPISSVLAWASQTFSRNQHAQCPAAQNKPNCAAVDASQASAQTLANHEPLYDVYLGGSLSTGTKWREEIAIPLLKKHGVRYYNPAIRDSKLDHQNSTSEEIHTESWHDDVSRWRQEIGQCRTALFVISNDTRSLTSMILAAHYIGSGKDVILSVEQLNGDSCVVANETLTKNAIKDYNRARAYLKDLAERRQVAVFDSPEQAVRCALSKLSITSNLTDDASLSNSTGDAQSRTELLR